MSEENKKDDFLSGHEELLNSIKKPEDESTDEAVEPAAEIVEESSTPVETPEEVAEPEALIEEEPEQEVEEEPEPVEEAEPEAEEEPQPVAEEEPASEPEPEEEPVLIEEPVKEVPPVVKKVPAPEPKPKKKPATPAEAKRVKKETLENAEVKEVLDFMNKYLKPAAIVIVVICVLFMGDRLKKNLDAKKEAAADLAMMEASGAADYQAILDDYGKTATAPIAMMALARETFNEGKTAEAEAIYSDFLAKYKNHDLAIQAEFAAIKCQEAAGKYEDASKGFAAFKAKHPKSHLAPIALLGQGRCLEALGQLSQAKTVYEDLTQFYSESGAANVAAGKLAIIESKL